MVDPTHTEPRTLRREFQCPRRLFLTWDFRRPLSTDHIKLVRSLILKVLGQVLLEIIERDQKGFNPNACVGFDIPFTRRMVLIRDGDALYEVNLSFKASASTVPTITRYSRPGTSVRCQGYSWSAPDYIAVMILVCTIHKQFVPGLCMATKLCCSLIPWSVGGSGSSAAKGHGSLRKPKRASSEQVYRGLRIFPEL
jgi:hypothetical protein